jgi:transposase
MRGKTLQIDWQEDEAALKAAYQNEQNATVKTRLHLLWLVRQGHLLTQAAPLVGVHYRTAQEWIAWYKQGGLAQVKARKRGGVGRQPRLNPEQKEALLAKARGEGLVSVKDGLRFVQEQFGVTYTESGMNKVFSALELRKKVPRPRNAKASQEVQESYKKGG